MDRERKGDDGWRRLMESLEEGTCGEPPRAHPPGCPCCVLPENSGIEAFRAKLRASLGGKRE